MQVKRYIFVLFIISVIFLYPIPSATQTKESTPDSLISQFKYADNDSIRVYILREIVNFWKVRDCDSNIYYSRVLAKKAKQTGIGNFYYKGIYWLTNCYGIYGMYDSALHYTFQGIEYFKNDSVSFQKTVLHILAGEHYRAMAMYDQALIYLKKAWDLAQQLQLPHVSYSIANRLGAVYFENKQKEKALHWADTSLKIGFETCDDDYYLSNLNIIGAIYRDKGEHDSSLNIFLKALRYAKKNTDSTMIAEIRNNIANNYRNLHEPLNAIHYAKPSFSYTSRKRLNGLSVVSAEILSYSYAETGKYKEAYKFARIYEDLRNDLFFEERDRQIAELSTKYETKEKERQIELQKMNLEKKDLLIRQKDIISIAFVIILFLLLFFLAFRHWSHQKLKKVNLQLTEKNNLILEQKNKIEEASKKIEKAYNKLQEMDEFKQATTRMLVHDLKNPLNLLTNIDVFENETERTSIVKQSSRQMLNLVLNILDISKAENNSLIPDKKELNPREIIDQALQEVMFMARPKALRISNEVSGTYVVKADEELIKRVFVNLLINAIRHSPQGGTITVSISVHKGKPLKLSFKDQGPGIASGHQQAIFEQFTQVGNDQKLQKGSTGLGLAFCKIAVEAHGWNISVDSETGKGANFIIEIDDCFIDNTKPGIVEPEKRNVQSLNKAELSGELKDQLRPHLDELQRLPVNAISEIKKNLNVIRAFNEKAILLWTNEVEQAAETFDEEKYLFLIKSLKHEQL